MMSAIDTMIEIKQLQVMGKFSKEIQEVPESYNEYKIKRLKRFYRVLLEDISLARILNLKNFLISDNIFNAHTDIITGTMRYLNSIKVSYNKHPEIIKEEEQKRRKY